MPVLPKQRELTPLISPASKRYLFRWLFCSAVLLGSVFASDLKAQTVATPTISPSSGLSYAQFNATLSDSTTGATIYYTLDNSTPTTSSSSVTSGGTVLISKSETLKAMAAHSGYTNSAVATSTYQITGQVVAGNYHTISLRSDGSVWTWGDNANGQIGDNTTTQRLSPVHVTTLSGMVEVSAGYYHSVALKSDGTVWAWGLNSSGQCGDNTANTVYQRNSPVEVQKSNGSGGTTPLTNIVAVCAGGYHNLALDSSGHVWAWGLNSNGQLGDGGTTQQNMAEQLTTLSGVTVKELYSGSCAYHSMLVTSTGTVMAWGLNSSGQLGDGTTTQRNSPVAISFPSIGTATIAAVSCGEVQSVAVDSNGTVWTWGSNGYGELGNGTGSDSNVPYHLTSLSNIVEVTCGNLFTSAVKSDGTLWSFGMNTYGELGDSTMVQRNSPAQATNITGAMFVTAGNEDTIVTNSNGTLSVMGSNNYNELGDNLSPNVPNAGAVFGFTTQVSSISTGCLADHMLALDTSHNVWSWGNNCYGQIGDNTSYNRIHPVAVTFSGLGTATITAVAANGSSCMALDSNNTVWSWGGSDIGNNTYTNYSQPVHLTGLSGITAISDGFGFGLALDSGTNVWSWGKSSSGQGGHGNLTEYGAPAKVLNYSGGSGTYLSGVSAISVGGGHCLALVGGAVYAWGDNTDGELGNGTTTNSSIPVAVSGLSGVTIIAISAGSYFSAALDSNNHVWTWGYNGYGQLGNGNTTNQTTAVEVTVSPGVYLSNVTSIACQASSVIARKNDGTVWAWGDNYGGEIGIGTITASVPQPTQVLYLSGVVSIGSGHYFSYALKQDGTLESWGANDRTGLGAGTNFSAPFITPGFNLLTNVLTPTVSITAPANNTTVALGSSTTFTASASETGGTVASVGYYVNSTLIGTSTTGSSFSFTWTPSTWGNYTFYAIATDTNGNTSYLSSPITVQVPYTGVAVTPTFSPGGGTYTSSQNVVISCLTPSATIYNTTDGSTPTISSAHISSGGTVTVTSSETIKAMAVVAGFSNSTVATATYTLPAPPVITAATTVDGDVGASISFPITATNSPTSYSATGLPPGLTLNTSSGVISGTPTSAGVYNVYVSAFNGGGAGTGFVVFDIVQSSAAPVINSPAVAVELAGSPIAFQVTASNNPTQFDANVLPAGLAIDVFTGVISGTVTTPGIYTINLSAANGSGTGTAVFSLAVNAGSGGSSTSTIISSLTATGTTGQPFTYTITANNNPTSFSSFDLPSGLSLNSTTGVISGTPVNEGTYPVLISAISSSGITSAILLLNISNVALGITSAPTVNATVGEAFSYSITASNNPSTYTASSLPTGFTFDSTTGVIYGTPTTIGTYSITLGATNSLGTYSATLSLNVIPHGPPVISSPTVIYATAGQPFSYTITASNSPTSYGPSGWSSDGLSLNSTTGVISGTPTAVGTPNFTVSATNAAGTGSSSLMIVVQSASPGITSTVYLQAGVSPTSSYESTSAWLSSDFSDEPVSDLIESLDVGTGGFDGTATDSDRTLLGFDLSSIPEGAQIVSASLTLTDAGNSTLASDFTVDVYEALAFQANTASWSDCSYPSGASEPGVLSSLDPYGNVDGIYVWSTSDNFTNAVQNSLGGTLSLLLVSSDAELSGEVENINFNNETASPSSLCPLLTITYALSSPPVITNLNANTPVQVAVNTAFNFPVATQNSPGSYSATGLPSGLSIDSSTGVIAGTATTAGTFQVTLSAVNANGTGSVTFDLNIVSIVPVIESPVGELDLIQGVPMLANSYQVPVAGQASSFASSNFPAGLSIDNNGFISGTPTSSGTFTGTVTATNSAGVSAAVSLTIKVAAEPAPSVPAQTVAGIIGTSFDYQIQAPVGSIGAFYRAISATSYSVSPSLPTGLTLDASTGEITGTPEGSISSTTSYSFTITASNAGGSGSGPLTINLYPTSPGLTCPLTAYAKVGVPFSFPFAPLDLSSLGPQATFSATALPPGLTSSSYGYAYEGYIAGTPTTSGTYNVILNVSYFGISSTATLVLTVIPATSFSASAQVGVPFTFTVPDSQNPTNFQAVNLPPGLSLNSTTGVISGTPQAVDTVPVQLTITDALGTQSGTLTLAITPNPNDTAANFQQGVSPTSAYTTPAATIETDSSTASVASQTFSVGQNLPVGQISTTASSRALLAFDLSALPPNATITSASLVMNATGTNSSGAPLTVEVHQAGVSFSAGSATWVNNNFYQLTDLSSLSLNPSSVSVVNTFPATAAFAQAAQQCYGRGNKLYLTLAAPSVETTGSPDYVGFVTNATNPAQNPQLMVTYIIGNTNAAPVITSSAVVTGTVNTALTYTISSTGNPQSFAATNLPAGLALNVSTGAITGTVTSVSSTTATISATNANGTGSKNVTFNIDSATPATSLQVVSGNNQAGMPGVFLSQPLVVEALAGGVALPNALITFSVPSGQGAFALTNTGTPTISNTQTAVTNASGEATVYFQTPQSLGNSTVVANAGTAQPVSLIETTAANAAVSSDSLILLSVISGEGQTGPAGQTLAQPFVVQATNAFGQPVISQSIICTATPSGCGISSTAGGTFGSTLNLTTDALGQATIYMQPGGTNGTTNTVSCSPSGGSSVLMIAATGSAAGSTASPSGGSPPETDPSLTLTISPFPFVPPPGEIVIPYEDLVYQGYGGIGDDPPTTDPRHITLQWNAIPNASSYLVERLDDTGTWTTLDRTPETSDTDENLYSEINYQYRVTAWNGSSKLAGGVVSYSVPLVQGYAIEGRGYEDFDYVDDSEIDLYANQWVDYSVGVGEGDYRDSNLALLFQGFYQAAADIGGEYYKLIFNPTKTAGIFTWYTGSGAQLSAPTNVRESPAFPAQNNESAGYNNAGPSMDPLNTVAVGGLYENNSADQAPFLPPGGIIGENSSGTFTVYTGENIEDGVSGNLSQYNDVTVSYIGSSNFRVQNDQENVIPSGTQILSGNPENYGNGSYDVNIVPTNTSQSGDSITFTITSVNVGSGITSGTQTFTYTYQPNPPDFSIPIDESSGSRYRKIALNGLPIGDEKPQQSAESDQEKEETYIDAMTLGLRHSTTDVYMPVSGSDFSVSARRDFRSQVWSNRNGLRPHEQPDQPFGMCWSSNLAPNIKFSHNDDPKSTTPDQATVTDETGAVHSFYRWYDGNRNPQFFPMPSGKNEAQIPNLETLTENSSANPVAYTFTRKYGASLIYQTTTFSQSISNDRTEGSSHSTTYAYARLVQAVDRVGNTVNYQFANTTDLVPITVAVANQPQIKLSIQQEPLSTVLLAAGSTSPQSVITAIWDANGNKTTFGYSIAPGDTDAAVLTSVTTPDGAVTHYTYNAANEPDQTPHASGDPGSTYTYADITSITDPLGNAYSFTYNLDHSKLNHMDNPQLYVGYYVQSGSPRNIATVTMPDSTTGYSDVATFANNSLVWLENAPTGQTGLVVGSKSVRQSQITDSTGFVRTYGFSNSDVISLPSFPQPANNVTESKMIVYQNLTIGYGNLGSETFQFDVNAAMALEQITDFSGNVTTFTHTDAWSAPSTYSQIISGATLNGFYDDPTSQTDALGHSKAFTYFGANRIMQSSTDENGNKTYYDIDSLSRRTTEKLYDPNNTLVQETDFTYGNSAYPGFMTQKSVQAIGGGSDPSWTQSLVTQYVPDANGRVYQEIVDPGGLNLVTSYSYDANGNKLTATDPKGHTSWFSYDSRNRLTTVTYADGSQKQMVYDARGNKRVEYDENGYATLYDYDSLNRLTRQVRDMNGNGAFNVSTNTLTGIDTGTDLITAYSYDKVNDKLTTTAPNGGITTMAYDSLQRVTDLYSSPDNSVQYHTQFAYGANSGGNAFDSSSFKPTHTVDPRGFTTDIAYDALYRPITKAVQYAATLAPTGTTTKYDNVGNAVLVTDPLGHQTQVTYDALNRPILTTEADGNTTQAFYTSTGFKWKAIDENSHATQTQYDNAGRPVVVTQPTVDNGFGTQLAPITKTYYDAAGNVAETVNPLGNTWDYVFDARNRKLQEFEPAVADKDPASSTYNTAVRPTLTWQYDAAGRVLATIDARGHETDTVYDAANRVTDVNAPSVPLGTGSARPNTHSTYDLDGNVLTLRDANSHTTTNSYDLLNRLLSSVDAAGITVTNTYDQVGNKLTVQDGNLHTTSFAYDGLNRNTTVTDAAGKVTTLSYDALNKTSRTDALGQATTYFYDMRNRLQDVVYASAAVANSQRHYAYDNVGNLLAVTEPSKTAANVAYSYDALNRATLETSGGLTHKYLYDLAGNRLTTLYGAAGVTVPTTTTATRILTSTYDALNRLNTLEDQTPAEFAASTAGRSTTYGYDLNGNISLKTAPNGDTEAYTFDALNRSTDETTKTSGNSLLCEYAYGYDLVGNVLTVGENYPSTSGMSNRTVTNTYDAINRLHIEAVTGAAPNVTTTYGYDSNNNRLTKQVAAAGSAAVTTTYAYNNLNQLTGYTDTGDSRSVSLGYDLDGNRTSRTVTGGSDNGTDTYSYDFENRLIGLVKGTSGGAGTYAYTYDYRTRRIIRDESGASGGSLTNLIFSGGTSVQEYTGTITSVHLTVENLRGSDYGGGVGGILYTIRGGTPSYTHENKRGDVVAKTDASGNLTFQSQYEAFGKQTATTGSTLDRQKSNSKDTDPTGLVDEGHRYRDLETGMFINRDPMGFVDGPNLYTYVIQNPWTKFDPEGLEQVNVGAAIVAGATGGAGVGLVVASPTAEVGAVVTVPVGAFFGGIIFGGAAAIHNISEDMHGLGGSGPMVSPPPSTGGSTTSTAPASGSNTVAAAPPAPSSPPPGMTPPPPGEEKPPGKGVSTVPGNTSALDTAPAPAPAEKPPEPSIKYHYTSAPESSFANGLWEGSSVTDDPNLTSDQAVARLGIKSPPDKIIPVIDDGAFVPNKPAIVDPHPLGPGGGTDFTNPARVPPSQILPAVPVK